MKLGIISDELGDDLGLALDASERLGLHGVELRKVHGRSWADLADAEVIDAVRAVRDRGLEVFAFATPSLKCSLPGAPAPAGALHGASAKATLQESLALHDRVVALAARTEVPFVRVFSGWRIADPSQVLDLVAEVVGDAHARAAEHGVEVLLENEHDCNVATAAETAALLDRVPGLRVIWDAANHVRAGGDPADATPPGAADRVAHVHLKDVGDGRWVPVGTGRVPYADVVGDLQAAGYDGAWSLETHCEVDGSVFEASRVGLAHLREVASCAR